LKLASGGCSVTDVDGDGKPDLLVTFDMADVKSGTHAEPPGVTCSTRRKSITEASFRIGPSLVKPVVSTVPVAQPNRAV
jgi:FG-GAP repeat